MIQKVNTAGQSLQGDYAFFEKQLTQSSPFAIRPGCWNISPADDYNAFWFHPDHLGSSSYISNNSGEISQHLEYFPFGETLVEEHKNSNNSPYKFNAKELDNETGNYYYGARYYNPKWSFWLSVDPLTEKYPGWSPYNYTLQNPIRFIDPDGMAPIGPPVTETLFSIGKVGSFQLTNDFAFRPFSQSSWDSSNIVAERTYISENFMDKLIVGLGSTNRVGITTKVSVTIKQSVGQYYSNDGSKVKNISQASKLIINSSTSIEEIRLNDAGGTSKVKVGGFNSSLIFNVTSQGTLDYQQKESDFPGFISGNKYNHKNDYDWTSRLLRGMADKFEQKNKNILEGGVENFKALEMENRTKGDYDDLMREINQPQF